MIQMDNFILLVSIHGQMQRGGGHGVSTPPENSQKIGFLSCTGPDPLKNHKATKPAFNVGPSSARQRNAIEMAFHWQVEDGPFIVIFGSSISSSTKKTFSNMDPL